MALPSNYTDWSNEAKDRYQEMKKFLNNIRVIKPDLTDEEAQRINAMTHKAQEIDAGDGLMFEKVVNAIKAKFIAKTH